MYLLIPAAGMGRRMGSRRNKLLLTLLGQPLLAWTLMSVKASQSIQWVGIIGQPEDWTDLQEITTLVNLPQPVELITGGSTRQESVYNGLQALPPDCDRVLIHDGARCLVTPDLFHRCGLALQQCDGLVAAIPVKDTIKIIDVDLNTVESTPERNRLWAAQTPQGFYVPLLKQCHEQGRKHRWEVTDDAALFEQCGLKVTIVLGEEGNLKVTTPMDLAIAELILNNRSSTPIVSDQINYGTDES